MITQFKIFETGEWSSNVDWEFVKNNPGDDSEEANWIKDMEEKLTTIQNDIKLKEIPFEIVNIKGFDMYQGPYATIKIDNSDEYAVWFSSYNLWIEDFPIDNCSEKGKNPGFEGDIYDIINVIFEEYKPINKQIRKYNL